MNSEFAGRVALVTGAAGDIGRAIAATLSTGGARVAASDLAGTSLPSDIAALALRCDVGDAQAVEALVEAVEQRLGPIDHSTPPACCGSRTPSIWPRTTGTTACA
jgi:NAD(P)-dependent dehydrogenase (short-subunit alcohol dehydrogenase family)